jgi:16S rRNA (guanine527-N7)-methyltransferase
VAETADYRRAIEQAAPELERSLSARLAQYIGFVDRYSHSMNLTGFASSPTQLAARLVGESLLLAELEPLQPGSTVVDLGSGVGSPVVPLALANPQVRFTAVESREKRALFLDMLAAKLRLANFEVANRRAQDVVAAGYRFEMVTSRAFAPPAELVPLARELLAEGGTVRGYGSEETTQLDAAAAVNGFGKVSVQWYKLEGKKYFVYLLK